MSDYGWLLSGGAFFTIIGFILLFMGRGEEKSYFGNLPYRTDVREFLEHWPPRVRLGAVKIGGKVSIAVGVALLIAGVLMWRWADVIALF